FTADIVCDADRTVDGVCTYVFTASGAVAARVPLGQDSIFQSNTLMRCLPATGSGTPCGLITTNSMAACGGDCPAGLLCMYDPGDSGASPGCACLDPTLQCQWKSSCGGLCFSPQTRCLLDQQSGLAHGCSCQADSP